MKKRVQLPPHAPGLRIGLFGGTFNPPHDAHRAASLLAMKKLRLDRVWWLVTPGNPLKDKQGLPKLESRIEAAQAIADHPRIDVSGLEAVIGAQYSRDTIAWLINECPGVRFVWIMGADNLKNFHRWKDWRAIFGMVADRGGGPGRRNPDRDLRPRFAGLCPRPHPGNAGHVAARPPAAGLGLPARPQILPVVHRNKGGRAQWNRLRG